jgi:drug/metabolite transporter (DMT)-like permease|tara:strand:+ start:42366 stop:43325 length:960 start_codon:yes stop_codon:yes gene_type:complete
MRVFLQKLPWQSWAVGEGLSKVVGGALQKAVGRITSSPELGFLAFLVSGTVQMIVGVLGFLKVRSTNRTISLFPSKAPVLKAISFGFFATFMTVLGIYTFQIGADLGVRTLIVASSIIPGALFDRIFFGGALGIRHGVGIAIFLFAVWAMLNFPMNVELEMWVWLTFLIAVAGAINETLTKAVSGTLNIFVNGFWVGSSIMFFCIGGLLVMGATGDIALSPATLFWIIAVIIGLNATIQIAFKFLAYKTGKESATIQLKKLIMNSVYLIGVSIVGFLIFSEEWFDGKWVGILLFPLAFILIDNQTWSVTRRLLNLFRNR